MKKRKRLKLVGVRWNDILRMAECRTVGFLMDKKDGYISVASTVMSTVGGERFERVIDIPKNSILKMTEL
jgi:hypothetical protein